MNPINPTPSNPVAANVTSELPTKIRASILPEAVEEVDAYSASVLAASAMQEQLAATVQNSSDYRMLRARLSDCYLRIRGPFSIVWFERGTDGQLHTVADRFQGPVLERNDVQAEIQLAAEMCSRERRDLVRVIPSVKNLTSIHLPIALPTGALDVLTVLLVNSDQERTNSETMSAHHLVQAVKTWWQGRTTENLKVQLHGTAALLELVGYVEKGESLKESCSILANTLRGYLGCELVAVGLRGKAGLGCQVESLSSLGEFDPNSGKVRGIRAALDECAVRNATSVWPPKSEAEQFQLLASRKVAEDLRMEFVVTVPLSTDDESVCGAILLAGASSKLVEAASVNFLAASRTPLGRSLLTMRRADGGRVAQLCRRIFQYEHLSRWKIAGAVAVATALLMALPMHYRIPCECRIEPVERRFSVAPYDGLIENTFAQPGETVKAGQLLARMDGREVQWELAGVTAEASRAMKERDTHMARLQVPKSIMASLDVDRLTNRTELLKYRAENMELRSAVDGIVLAGSVDRRENFPVTVGQTLYEIAPLDKVRVEVAIPDEDASHVEPGMTVEVRMDALAGEVLSGTIERVRPRSEIRNEDNVFIAEIVLNNPDHKLRPGAEGHARVISSRRCLAWVWFHRAWEKTVTTFLW